MKTYFGTTFSPDSESSGLLKIPWKFILYAFGPYITTMLKATKVEPLHHSCPLINSIYKISGPNKNNMKNNMKTTMLPSVTPLNIGR